MAISILSRTEKTPIQPVIVERDEDGYWSHPGQIATEDAVVFKAWLDAQGLAYSISSLEHEDDTHPAYVAYYMHEACGVPLWNPEAPTGDGWFLLSIHDADDGPVAVWVRRQPSDSTTA